MAFDPSLYIIERIGSSFLAIMPRPVPGEWLDDCLMRLKKEGIGRIVSLLEEEEAEVIGLADEKEHCMRHGIEFLSYPIRDRGLPLDIDGFAEFTLQLYEQTGRGTATAIHCRAGIGRASVVAAGVLLQCGFEPLDAFELIQRARGVEIPDTMEQRQWIIDNHHQICQHKTRRPS
jgi:protein-tyrosine phosphatase